MIKLLALLAFGVFSGTVASANTLLLTHNNLLSLNDDLECRMQNDDYPQCSGTIRLRVDGMENEIVLNLPTYFLRRCIDSYSRTSLPRILTSTYIHPLGDYDCGPTGRSRDLPEIEAYSRVSFRESLALLISTQAGTIRHLQEQNRTETRRCYRSQVVISFNSENNEAPLAAIEELKEAVACP